MKNVRFEVLRDIKWDNWGNFVTVFKKGDIVKGELYENGDVCAESTIWAGIYDLVDLESIVIIEGE